MTVTFYAPRGLSGRLTPPPDKSITHRALMLAAISAGHCRVENPLLTGDCLSTRDCLLALGVPISQEVGSGSSTVLRIDGQGPTGFREPADILDGGNSGTTTRLLAGLLAGQRLYAVLSGDASLRSRPMLRVVEPLRCMGADIRGRGEGRFLPLTFLPGAATLSPLEHRLTLPSAQVKSALLLAALRGEGASRIGGATGSRDHTERLFRYLDLPLSREGEWLIMASVSKVPSFELIVPGDISSASFFIAAALIAGRNLEVESCGLNPSRLGFLQVLKRMGARIEQEEQGSSCGEPWGTIQVFPQHLRAVEVTAQEVPYLIDEIPLLAVLGAFCTGTTRVRGAEELRHKESDRLQAVARLLACVGGSLTLLDDGFSVEGPQRLHSGRVDPGGDHRIAMAAAVLASGIPDGVRVDGFEAAGVSFPDFLAVFRSLGGEAQ